MGGFLQFKRFILILASFLCTTTAFDLKCEYYQSNERCEVVAFDLKPVSSTEEVNIVIPHTWEADKVKYIYIQTFGVAVPFPKELFKKFPNVNESEIRISLEMISTETFKQANALVKLDLSNNNIERIDDFAFIEAPKLKELSLYWNQLTKIRKNTFAGLASLLELNLASNKIDEIEEGALNLPQLALLELQGNKLKAFSDLSNPSHWNNLKELYIGYNPWDAVDLKIFSKYEHLEILELSNTNFDLDACNVTPDDISSSRSKIMKLDLTESKMQSGIIFAKLKIFPNLETFELNTDSLTTIDFDVIKNGGLPKLTSIWLRGNNFDKNWLDQAAENSSLTVEPQYGYVILRKSN